MHISSINLPNIKYNQQPIQNSKSNINIYNNSIDSLNFTESKNIDFKGWFWDRNKTKPVINPSNLAMFDNPRNFSEHIMCGGFGSVIQSYDCYRCKNIFSSIKKEGKIDAIIYLGESEAVHDKMQQSIKKSGLKYFNLSIWGFTNWFNYDGDKISVKQKVVDKLKEMFDILNSGDNVVIGCDQGKQRTSQALFFNHYLNDKNKQSGEDLLNTCKGVTDITLLNNFVNVKELFNALSDKQKAELGISDKVLPKIEIKDLDTAIQELKHSLLSNIIK